MLFLQETARGYLISVVHPGYLMPFEVSVSVFVCAADAATAQTASGVCQCVCASVHTARSDPTPERKKQQQGCVVRHTTLCAKQQNCPVRCLSVCVCSGCCNCTHCKCVSVSACVHLYILQGATQLRMQKQQEGVCPCVCAADAATAHCKGCLSVHVCICTYDCYCDKQ